MERPDSRERVDYLTRFLEGYARFARLRSPTRQGVDWREWLEGPQKLYTFELLGEAPQAQAYFDPSQLQQVLINLLKNAVEAHGGHLRIQSRAGGGTAVSFWLPPNPSS